MSHLRAWRESLGLSRQALANKIATLHPEERLLDQATIAKWETGETAVRVEDLQLLARVYGVTPDRLFFAPGDSNTPAFFERAFHVITNADPDLVSKWLETGEGLRSKED